MNKELYRKLRVFPIFVIIISIFVIGINMVRGYKTEYLNKAENFNVISDITYNDVYVDYILNINSATYEELLELPGITNAIAKLILEFRLDTGGFKSVDELLLIEGITEAKFKELLPFVMVGDC